MTSCEDPRLLCRGCVQPFSFHLGVGEVIRGWDVGVATMRTGERARLYIPQDWAYGDAGSGPIPPRGTPTPIGAE